VERHDPQVVALRATIAAPHFRIPKSSFWQRGKLRNELLVAREYVAFFTVHLGKVPQMADGHTVKTG
jgi:hypothetical protein